MAKRKSIHAVLLACEMRRAEEQACILNGTDSFALMLAAGKAIADHVARDRPACVHILCGPGNNGGDGWIAAAELRAAGVEVRAYALGEPQPGKDAVRARREWTGKVSRLADFQPQAGDWVIDALFGAGLTRMLPQEVLGAIARSREADCRIVAADLPSGVSSDSGRILGGAFCAHKTLTFFRKKPGHLLDPGRDFCGEVLVEGIGMPDKTLDMVAPLAFENNTELWLEDWPLLKPKLHKYSRGAVAVFSGGLASTGAARLSAMAAQRAGAGAVTVLSPGEALQVNACHLTSIMLARLDSPDELAEFLGDGKRRAFVIGPGFGLNRKAEDFIETLAGQDHGGMVIDADGLTAMARRGGSFGKFLSPAVLTPHEGEFRRLFPDLAQDVSLSKLDKARQAAVRTGAIILYKGPDTVIASPEGEAVINANGTVGLATAGSGDVLAGIVAALLARGMPAFHAAAAGAFVHGEAGRRAGRFCIAEDLPGQLPSIMEEIERLALSLN